MTMKNSQSRGDRSDSGGEQLGNIDLRLRRLGFEDSMGQ